jgi:hypothetical protein
MTKAIRWSDDELDAYKNRLIKKSQGAAMPQKPVAQKVPDVAPPAASAKKASKYKNTKVEIDGITHDSSKEARRWAVLQRQAAAGEITDLKRQQSFVLAPAVRLEGEPRKKPAIRYFSDFTYLRDGVLVVEDTKSRPTRKLPAYRIKRHLMATVLNIQIKEV